MSVCYAQKVNFENDVLQNQIYSAISKAYPASVLMWEIDSASGNRMSAQFSGVVVKKEGTILSAAHVVMSGKVYKVMFADGRECTAKGLGRITIPPNFMIPDAAMLQINESGPWPFAEMGWSSSLKVGQPCLSIAYPESVEQRKPNIRLGQITVLKNQHGFLVSSCIMEPGDSGGPLFDLDGRVVGIHSGIQAPEDVNYEVPVDTYRKYWSALRKSEDYKTLPKDTDQVTSDTLFKRPIAGVFNKIIISTSRAYPDLMGNCLKIKSVVNGNEEHILGTVVSIKGMTAKIPAQAASLLISKSSMVGSDPIVINSKGELLQGRIVSRSRKEDLVLITLPKNVGKGVELISPGAKAAALGTILFSPLVDTLPRTGILSTSYLNLTNKSSYGYIGAATVLQGDKVVLTKVLANSAAADGDMQIGDVIYSVGKFQVEDELDFVKALQGFSAGDTIAITGARGNIKFQKLIILKYPPQRVSSHPADHFPGGKSVRRDGFANAIIQDAIIMPNQCGGPVFDIHGRFIGINIARLSRTSTVIIPSTNLARFLLGSF